MISGNDPLQRLRVAFAKETTFYVRRLGLPPMVEDLPIGTNKGLRHAVSVPFLATWLQSYLSGIGSVTFPLTVAKHNGHACLCNSASDAIHLNRLPSHRVVYVSHFEVFALES